MLRLKCRGLVWTSIVGNNTPATALDDSDGRGKSQGRRAEELLYIQRHPIPYMYTSFLAGIHTHRGVLGWNTSQYNKGVFEHSVSQGTAWMVYKSTN